ncbi:MAG: hypothetical protein HYU99_05750 [Deltaproteobacteria bacterium]|nr:hypothetical protein [Deltaproteobacteria bacterium]
MKLFRWGTLSSLFLLLTFNLINFNLINTGCGSSATPSADIPATVSSLSSVPSLDLSNLDSSASPDANLTAMNARASKLASHQVASHQVASHQVARLGEDMRGEGKSSRAGCEANAHKDEIFRMSQMAQLDRCYPEAMESAGLFTIGDGFSYYSLTPPEMGDEEKERMCDDIPPEKVDERTACEEGTAGGPKDLKIRLGLIDGALQIDMCESDALQNEATYTATGSVYTATVTRVGNFLGTTEGSKFAMTVDLGTSGTVTDSLVALGDGSASASAQMNSSFGNGLIAFDASASNNAISGAFNGAFTDPFTDVDTSFTGKVRAEFGPEDGCAKFSFTGAPPPMRVQDMIPFDISADQLDGFLQVLGLELGIELTADNYETVNLCPNPLFDPENPSTELKPMVAANDDGACPTVTSTGIECFTIANGVTTSDFGAEEYTQTFTTASNDSVSFYATVNAFDLSALDPTVDTVAFSRNWDCTGSFTSIDFASLTDTQLTALQEGIEECNAIQEEAFNRDGMGGYNCHQQEEMNGINDLSGEGPPDLGNYGGVLGLILPIQGSCLPDIGLPDLLFIDAVNVAANTYCLPVEASCDPFDVEVGPPPNAPGLDVTLLGDTAITNLSYTQPDPNAPAESVLVTFAGSELALLGGSCTQRYSIVQPTFEAPLDPFEGDGGGEEPPQACIDLFGDDVTREECEGFCMSPDGRDAC